jgi:hypothetical protein
MRPRCLLPVLLLLLLPATSAAGNGLPPTDVPAGRDGVLGPGGSFRFGALATKNGTVVTKTQVRGGRLLRAEVLRGRWGVPVVANDGTAGGLSADGKRLVLVRGATTRPLRSTTLAVLGAGLLGVRQTVSLKGKWYFDALSPDASTLYLIQALSRKRGAGLYPVRYAVRAYDLRAGRLLPDPIVDPAEADEPMRGFPVTRLTGPGGRWEYTLYAGGEHPFIHALDTVRRTALCLDLPHRVEQRLWSNRLVLRADSIQVVRGDRVVAAAPRRPERASTGDGPPWAVAVLVASGLIAAAGVRRLVAARDRVDA